MNRIRTAVMCLVLLGAASAAPGQVQTFRNDYAGFLSATGPVSTIDFETLPDGSPSRAQVQITSEFNYDLQGAHFSAPIGNPFIAGNTTTGFQLRSDTGQFGPHTWIVADLTIPTRGVGVFFPGSTTFCAFDAQSTQLGCVSYSGSISSFFVGITSVSPIARVTADSFTFSESIDSFVFAPVPEPGTAALFGLGGAFALGGMCRSRRDGRAAGAGDS